MIELYQAEWCPYSHAVRQRLTELGVPFVARQVAADGDARDEMRAAVGTDEIPVLVLDDGTRVDGEADEIIARLDSLYEERSDVDEHRRKAAEHAEETTEEP